MLSSAPKPAPGGKLQLHASTVVIEGRAIALLGPSGVGKSELALGLMAHGASLLADDITWITSTKSGLISSCPPHISGQIEARGLGILNASACEPAPLTTVLDLGVAETARLPEPKVVQLLDHSVSLLHKPETVHLIETILHYMRHDRAQ